MYTLILVFAACVALYGLSWHNQTSRSAGKAGNESKQVSAPTTHDKNT